MNKNSNAELPPNNEQKYREAGAGEEQSQRKEAQAMDETTPTAVLDIEREKIAVEREKIALERTKAKWTAFSIAVPLLAASLTVVYGLWNTHQQSRSEFELRAAEIVMQSTSPDEALARANAFMAMFPNKLPRTFVRSFDPDRFTNKEGLIVDGKREFLRLLVEKGVDRQKLCSVWRQLFPADEWVDGFSAGTRHRPQVGKR